MEILKKYLPWIVALVVTGLLLWQHDVAVRNGALLEVTKKELEVSKKRVDSALAVYEIMSKNVATQLALLTNKVDSIERQSHKIITETHFKVDTFKVQLPDSLQHQFESIISGYEATIILKDTEIKVLKEKEILAQSLDSLQAKLISVILSSNVELEKAFKQASNIARPSLFSRIINKVPELGALVALYLFTRH